MPGEWGTTPWGGIAPDETAATASGYWGGPDNQLPVAVAFNPPCGFENIPVDTTISFTVLDPRTGVTTPGIDLSCTDVFVRIGTNPTVTVFTSSAFQAGWTSSTTTPVVGPPPGFDFELIPDVDFPPGTLITVTVVACNNDGQTSSFTCTFTTVSAVTIQSIELLSRRRIIVRFSNPITSLNADNAVLTASNWNVRPIPGNQVHNINNVSSVLQVITEDRFNPNFVILIVQPLVEHQRYEVTATGFSDIFQQAFNGSQLATTEARRTKVDVMLEGLPKFWEGERTSNLFWILSALAQQDEKIGGAQGIIPSGSLQRLF